MKNLYYNLVRDLYCNHVDLLFPQLFYISIIMIKYELFPIYLKLNYHFSFCTIPNLSPILTCPMERLSVFWSFVHF